MPSLFLVRFMMLPGLLMHRGPRAYYGGTLVLHLLLLCAALVWLGAPVAIWGQYGHWWMLFWLVPTTTAIFASALMPLPGGG